MKREQIKALIELSNSYEEANEIIEKYAKLYTYEEKIAYIRGMFNCEIFHTTIDSKESDYIALLTTIINQKWL